MNNIASGCRSEPGLCRGVMPLRVRAGEALALGARGDLNRRGGVTCDIASAGRRDGSGVTSLAGLMHLEQNDFFGLFTGCIVWPSHSILASISQLFQDVARSC